MSPIFQNRNVPCGSRQDISAVGEGRGEAFTPGMIRSRHGGRSLFLESEVEMFGRDNFGLSGLLVVNGEGQSFGIIPDGNLFIGMDTDDDLGVTQGIGRAFGLDLVDGFVELEGEIFGKGTSFLPGEDTSQVIFGGERAMGIDVASGLFCEALVEIIQELR